MLPSILCLWLGKVPSCTDMWSLALWCLWLVTLEKAGAAFMILLTNHQHTPGWAGVCWGYIFLKPVFVAFIRVKGMFLLTSLLNFVSFYRELFLNTHKWSVWVYLHVRVWLWSKDTYENASQGIFSSLTQVTFMITFMVSFWIPTY